MGALGFWLFVIGWMVAISSLELGAALIALGSLLMLLRAAWWFTFEVM